MRVHRISKFTGKHHVMELPVTLEQFEKWEGGMLIQNAFPNLTPDEREFIKFGCTKAEWDEMFPPQPDEDDDDEANVPEGN